MMFDSLNLKRELSREPGAIANRAAAGSAAQLGDLDQHN